MDTAHLLQQLDPVLQELCLLRPFFNLALEWERCFILAVEILRIGPTTTKHLLIRADTKLHLQTQITPAIHLDQGGERETLALHSSLELLCPTSSSDLL